MKLPKTQLRSSKLRHDLYQRIEEVPFRYLFSFTMIPHDFTDLAQEIWQHIVIDWEIEEVYRIWEELGRPLR